MAETGTRAILVVSGAVSAALLSAACCLGPLVLAFLGLGGASMALALEPYRPWFLGATAIFLGFGFYYAYRRPRQDCGEGEACPMPRANYFGQIMLWVATVVVILAAAFPNYSIYLF